MNLTQWFNLDYFMQNLKKSKAVVIFISLLVPVFTALLLLTDSGSHVISFAELGAFNTLFMYIVPVVLSIALFNFVFKKKSCDFIGSMPISRQTLFITNTIGGIAILVLMQAFTAILSLIISKFASDALFFGAMIWDVFVFYTIAYIFVFTVCNLAISFSGNIFATIVSVLLILFFIPFTLECSKIIKMESNYDEINNDKSSIYYYEPYNFTAPSMFFEILDGNYHYEFNSKSATKMVVLSIAYCVIGFLLFGRKKYEYAEESYENLVIHLAVKFLTLTPFIAVLSISMLYEEGLPLLFFMVVLAVYYYLFDMITGKKVKLRITIPAFLISCLSMFAIFQLVVPYIYNLRQKSFKINDVKEICINSINDYGNKEYVFDLDITDKTSIINLLTNDSDYDSIFSIGYSYGKKANMTITLNDGKKHNIKKSISNSFVNDLGKDGDKKLSKSMKDYIPILEERGLSNSEKENLKEAIKKDLDGITYKEYYEQITERRLPYYLYFVAYRNHTLVNEDYSYAEFSNLTNEIAKILNEHAKTNLNLILLSNKNWANYGSMWELDDWDVLAQYICKKNPNIKFAGMYEPTISRKIYEDREEVEEEYTTYTYDDPNEESQLFYLNDLLYSEEAQDEVINKFVLNSDADFDINKPYFTLEYHAHSHLVFFSNDIEGFYKLLANWHNESVRKFIETGERPEPEAEVYMQLFNL